MQQTNKRPGAASPARRASVLKPQGNKAQHKARAGRRQPATFADWCQTDAPHQLGLDPDAVARICRVMSRPEMGGISSLDGLIKSLSWLRKPFYHDDLAWQRFLLTARYLWLVFKGKAPPRPPSAAPATIAGETATIAGENFADVIIARARGVRS